MVWFYILVVPVVVRLAPPGKRSRHVVGRRYAHHNREKYRFRHVQCQSRGHGKSRGYVALEALVSFLWGFSLKQKKPLDLSRGEHRPECTDSEKHCFVKPTEYRGRGCVSVEVISREGYVQS